MASELLTNITFSQPTLVSQPLSESDYGIHREWPAANQIVIEAWLVKEFVGESRTKGFQS